MSNGKGVSLVAAVAAVAAVLVAAFVFYNQRSIDIAGRLSALERDVVHIRTDVGKIEQELETAVKMKDLRMITDNWAGKLLRIEDDIKRLKTIGL
jgi:hypothetical protein